MGTLLALLVGTAWAERLPLGLYPPSAPIGPDHSSTCDAYEDLWEAIRKRIYEAHERCLDDNRGDARVEDGRCSVGACEELHAPERWGVQEVEACREAVRAAQEARRAAERRAAEEEAARRAAEEEARRAREAAEARARAEAERRAAEAEAKRQREEEARRASEEREAAERAQRIAAARAESQRAQDDYRARVDERERERDTLRAKDEALRERSDEERQRLDVAATRIVDALGASAPMERPPSNAGMDDLDWGSAPARSDGNAPVERSDPTILSYEEIGMSNVTRYSSGAIRESYEYVESASGAVKHGSYRRFYENGNPEVSGQYANGEKTGEWLDYNSQGLTLFRKTYINGKLEGVKTQYNPIDCENGVVHTTTYSAGVEDGPEVEYNCAGKKTAEGVNRFGARHGEWTFWSLDGSYMRKRGSYECGQKVGSWAAYNPDGSLSSSETKTPDVTSGDYKKCMAALGL